MNFPKLYAIVDADALTARSLSIEEVASGLFSAGVPIVQYRNKSGGSREILADTAILNGLRLGNKPKLIMNDRADLALLAGFDGVHVGQDDIPCADARRILGPKVWIGVSTHSAEQVAVADSTPCEYIALGPIFSTASKDRPDPVVGLKGLTKARAATRKPLVAIGGITRENCRAVLDAGADSVAVISDLLPPPGVAEVTTVLCERGEEFLALLEAGVDR